MKKHLTLAFMLPAIISFSQKNLPALYKKCIPSVVKITCVNIGGVESHGTGFFIDNEGTIVTCYHVVDNAYSVQIETYDGKKFFTDSIIASSKKNDLIKFTVIKYKSDDIIPLTLTGKLPHAGESVFTIGNPGDSDFSVSNGIVSAIRESTTGVTIQNTAPCSSGSSGSPLLNMKGEVIGVLSYIKYTGQNLNFATSAREILNMKDDNTIQSLHPAFEAVSPHIYDSLMDIAESEFMKKKYDRTIEITLPLTKFVTGNKTVRLYDLIASSYFLKQDYAKANIYFEYILKTLYEKKPHRPDDVARFTFALQKQGMCYYYLGAKQESLALLERSIEAGKTAFEHDTLSKEFYRTIIQTSYYYRAAFNYEMENLTECCMNWKLAKEWGLVEIDAVIEKACK